MRTSSLQAMCKMKIQVNVRGLFIEYEDKGRTRDEPAEACRTAHHPAFLLLMTWVSSENTEWLVTTCGTVDGVDRSGWKGLLGSNCERHCISWIRSMNNTLKSLEGIFEQRMTSLQSYALGRIWQWCRGWFEGRPGIQIWVGRLCP